MIPTRTETHCNPQGITENYKTKQAAHSNSKQDCFLISIISLSMS